MTQADPVFPQALVGFREAVRAEALRLGFSRAGFTSADPLEPAVGRRWRRWLAADKAGRMEYLRRLVPRRTHPRDLLDEARTAVVVLAGYYDGDHPPPAADGDQTGGRVARYAWGRDYHLVMREKLTQLGEWIARETVPGGPGTVVSFRPCVDSAPIDERALAVRAGLGFIGKNTLLLDPRAGSWCLIGVLLISLELPPDAPLRNVATGCGACRRCLEACPTGALSGPWTMDPRRCISYLTIESRDEIPAELGVRMENWAFGCDICQEVCPFNREPMLLRLAELRAEAGVGPRLTAELLNETPGNRSFVRRWRNSPIARPGLKVLNRTLRTLQAYAQCKAKNVD